MQAYSLDLRERILKAHDEGHWSVGQLAERFKVGEWWIHKLKRQRKQEGSLAARKGKVGQPRSLYGKQIEKLEKYVDGHPDATLEEIRERLGLSCSAVTVHHTLRRLGYRYKKNATGQRTRSRRSTGKTATLAGGPKTVASGAIGLPR